jgi:hypothetical protein
MERSIGGLFLLVKGYCADESDGGYFDLKTSTFIELRWLCSSGSTHQPEEAYFFIRLRMVSASRPWAMSSLAIC